MSPVILRCERRDCPQGDDPCDVCGYYAESRYAVKVHPAGSPGNPPFTQSADLDYEDDDAERSIRSECSNPHSRAKSGLTGGVELGAPHKSAPRRANVRGHGIGTEVQMHDEHTQPYAWSVSGESFHQGSSSPWKPEHHEGVIYAEGAGEALELIVRGLGPGTTLDNTIPWDCIEQDREITITIRPAPDPASTEDESS